MRGTKIPRHLDEWLTWEAAARGMSPSMLIRRLLEQRYREMREGREPINTAS